jgi:hypothetical protein
METLVALLNSDANAANAFAAMLSAVAALLAVLVSGISVIVAVRALVHQRKHNVLSVSPLPEVTVADYENSLRVKLRNNGTGPLLVKAVTIRGGTQESEKLIDCMPVLPTARPWTHFSGSLVGRSLQPGTFIPLLELTRSPGEERFDECRDIVRSALAPLSVHVVYTDVYGSEFLPYVKELSWFGRHFEYIHSPPRDVEP